MSGTTAADLRSWERLRAPGENMKPFIRAFALTSALVLTTVAVSALPAHAGVSGAAPAPAPGTSAGTAGNVLYAIVMSYLGL